MELSSFSTLGPRDWEWGLERATQWDGGTAGTGSRSKPGISACMLIKYDIITLSYL